LTLQGENAWVPDPSRRTVRSDTGRWQRSSDLERWRIMAPVPANALTLVETAPADDVPPRAALVQAAR
jgi:hypothetical protein